MASAKFVQDVSWDQIGEVKAVFLLTNSQQCAITSLCQPATFHLPFFVASLPIFCLLMLTPKNSVSCFVVATPGSESLVFAPQIPTSLSNIPVHIPAFSSTFSHFLSPFFQFLCVLLPHHFRVFVLLILHFRVFVSRSWELSFPVFFTLQIVSNAVHPV